jgi:secreted trypsin-like serine protease
MMKINNRILKFVLVSCMALALLVSQFGQALAITYGQVDATNQYSNVGAIMISIPGVGNFQFCSGTLIGERVFLTAGHCTYMMANSIAAGYFSLDNVKVSFDPLDINQPAGYWDVEALVTHPDFKVSSANALADIGLVILSKNPGISPAKLASAGYLDQLKESGAFNQGQSQASFTVVGYGSHLNWPPPEVVPGQGERYFTDGLYQSLPSKWLQYNQNPIVGNGGICFGDSGGPTFWTDSGGQRILVGVNSWVGAVNCNANGYSYRVDLPEINSFIQSVLDQYQD